MGGCCSKNKTLRGSLSDEGDDYEDDDDEEEEEEKEIHAGDWGATVRLKGSCNMASMCTQQGRKGVNQDAMTIWEDFTGEPHRIFCGVFDGHGPSGHLVATQVRDVLPSKLSLQLKSSLHKTSHLNKKDDSSSEDKEASKHGNKDAEYPPFVSTWATCFINAFDDMDKALNLDPTIDSYCSGSTAVTLLRQGDHLMVANLGDSRAILCARNKKNQLVPVQLTVDLKPGLPGEADRIRGCNGRVFAMAEEPNVARLWLPDEYSPGLAMSRAFGDFCLKDFGLISTPKIYYRRISRKDEFVVLATDGVWDVLSNKAVVRIVSSTRKRSMAARLLVLHAVQAWKSKHANSKVDDIAVICFFLKFPSSVVKAKSEVKEVKVNDDASFDRLATVTSNASHETQETITDDSKAAEWTALEGVSRNNTVLNLPRFSSGEIDESQTKRPEDDKENDEN